MIKQVIAIALLATAAAVAQNDEATRLNKEVRHELVMLPYLGVFDNLAYQIDGQKVTLLGQVTRPVLKTDAGRAVKAIEGVTNVDNQIEVLPLSPHDDRLRLSLYRAIYGYPSLNRYAMPVLKPIRIIVKNGHVTLEGVVLNEGDKTLVNMRARGVHGAFSVTNNLQVEKESANAAPRPPDASQGGLS